MKYKVVFDTNIFISAIIFGGNPKACMELARQGKAELYTSREILLELTQKLREKFAWSEEEVVDVVQGIAKFSKMVEPKEKVTIIKSDPTDNRILECAKEANVDFIISGDVKHVLSLKEFEGICILNAKDFLVRFYK